jgi:hypothetical protein
MSIFMVGGTSGGGEEGPVACSSLAAALIGDAIFGKEHWSRLVVVGIRFDGMRNTPTQSSLGDLAHQLQMLFTSHPGRHALGFSLLMLEEVGLHDFRERVPKRVEVACGAQ